MAKRIVTSDDRSVGDGVLAGEPACRQRQVQRSVPDRADRFCT